MPQLFGLYILPKQVTKHMHQTNPQDLDRHMGDGCTFALAMANLTSLAAEASLFAA